MAGCCIPSRESHAPSPVPVQVDNCVLFPKPKRAFSKVANPHHGDDLIYSAARRCEYEQLNEFEGQETANDFSGGEKKLFRTNDLLLMQHHLIQPHSFVAE